MSNKRLSIEECEELYDTYNTPSHVRKHCGEVARVAVTLGTALNEKGMGFDIELIRGAALLHDVARVCENHAKVGADILASLGYQDEADIIAVHMNYDIAVEPENLREHDLVCLGDRVVLEDQYVGLEKRMEYVVGKAIDHPGAVDRIRAHQKKTEQLIRKIEEKLGLSMEDLMKRNGD